VGNDQNMSTNLTGSSGALAVWSKIMARIAHKSLELKTPESVSYQWVDKTTGQLSGADCTGAKYLPFLKKTIPPRISDSCPVPPESEEIPQASSGSGSSVFDWF
jgi:penicillin-binding protein 1B